MILLLGIMLRILLLCNGSMSGGEVALISLALHMDTTHGYGTLTELTAHQGTGKISAITTAVFCQPTMIKAKD